MKYLELIKFEPITTVIQIQEADNPKRALELVKTFVFSEGMQERISNLFIPNLQFSKPFDNKGLLIVGNYGTGKSHLMSVISSIAEDESLRENLRDETLKKSFESVQGRFNVIRAEIGGVRMSLREIILRILERQLNKLQIEYEFPPADKIVNNKEYLIEMMGYFNEKYPDKGFLLVIDELLDYFLSRKDQELIYDLNFLREIGEVCKTTRFRFIAGIQESLFDNPRFQHVAQTLLKVKDRFQQMRIIREDIAFVISERLLKKTTEQKALIKKHLEQFAPLYPVIGERLDQFVELFPVHPKYIETFEKLYIAEKRQILKTLSLEIEKLQDKNVPDDNPGLLTFDSYWLRLKENPAIKALPEVKEVIDRSATLEDRIRHAFPKKRYKETAIKIIYGLSVHRLSTSDTRAKMGATLEELRDSLLPYIPGMPEPDAEFLHTTLEAVLKEILITVSYQFISYNQDNGQYFIDLDKDIDYDGEIERRTRDLDDNIIDRYYFEALKRVMECDTTTYVTGFNIWEHQLEWIDRKVKLSGYLFFGAPNERSTAQPPRNFYIYFLQLYRIPAYIDEQKSDEVFFKLEELEDEFEDNLKRYSAARELATRGGNARTHYEGKANVYLKILAGWLREHLTTNYMISYKGITRKAVEWLKTRTDNSFKDIVDTLSSEVFNGYFNDLRPKYPKFSEIVTNENRSTYANLALKYIVHKKDKLGKKFCTDLQLIKDDVINPLESPFGKYFVKLMKEKGKQQVINRNEIIEGSGELEQDIEFKIEPEWIIVVIAALIHSGHAILSVSDKKIDAANMELLLISKMSDLTSFHHIEQPKDLPLSSLVELSRLFEIPEGQVRNESTRAVWIENMQNKAIEEINALLLNQEKIKDGILFLGESILTKTKEEDLITVMNEYKTFLEGLQPYNTLGKLKNFKFSVEEIQNIKKKLRKIIGLDELLKFINEVSNQSNYLLIAKTMLPHDTDWSQNYEMERENLIKIIYQRDNWENVSIQQSIKATLNQLKTGYITLYRELHKKCRLGVNQDKEKTNLLKDNRIKQLNKVSMIEIVSRNQLKEFQDRITSLITCFDVTKSELQQDPKCPHCKFNPSIKYEIYGPNLIEELENQLGDIYNSWKNILLENLKDPIVKENLELLSDDSAKLISTFLDMEEYPEKIDNNFIQAVKDVLQGLIKVEIDIDKLKEALEKEGIPCKAEELLQRFSSYIENKLKGKDKKKVRILFT